MGKEKTEFEEQFVSKTEKAKKLWEKRIMENTTLSMESVQWMAQRINSLLEYMQYGYALIAYKKSRTAASTWEKEPLFPTKATSKRNMT